MTGTHAAVSDDVQKYSECSVVHFPLQELLGSEDVEARVLVKALLFVVLGLCGCYSGDFFNIQLILLNIGLYRGVVQSVVRYVPVHMENGEIDGSRGRPCKRHIEQQADSE